MLRKLFFNIWYILRKPPWDTGISPPELMAFIEGHPPGRALDLGCGTGTNVISLAKHGWQATGVDFASRAIRKAWQKAKRAGVDTDLRLGDVTKLDGITGPFDLILDIGCFHSLPSSTRPAYIHNVKHLLAPRGTYLLYVFFREPGAGPPGVVESELRAFSPPLKLVKREDGTNQGRRDAAWLMYAITDH